MGENMQEKIEQTGLNLYRLMEEEKPSVFKNEYWLGKMMQFCIQNDDFKTEMFRFVDVYPSLKNTLSIAQHLKEYFCRSDVKIPSSFQWGLKLLKPESSAAKIIATKMKKNIETIGNQFIVGKTIGEAAPIIKKLREQGIAVTLSVLGESVLSRKEENQYAQRIIELIESSSKIQSQWPALGEVDGDLDWGVAPKTNISIKISGLYSHSYNLDCSFSYAVDSIKERLRPILRKAQNLGVFIMLDVEHREWRSITNETFKSLLDENEFKEFPYAGIVFQSYHKDSESEIEKFFEWSKRRKAKFSIRLVKGGLWDEEVVHAAQNNHSIPVFTKKYETDAVFEKISRKVLKNIDKINLAVGSHNIRSVAAVIEHAKDLNISQDKIEFQLLNGMGENLRKAFVLAGLNVRIYAPIGDIIPGMSYLVRRLMDNTANHSFLKEDTFGTSSKKDMLRNPANLIDNWKIISENSDQISKKEKNNMGFKNEPAFSWNLDNISKFDKKLKDIRKTFPVYVPLVINGRELKGKKSKKVVNPNKIIEKIGSIAVAEEGDIDGAINSGTMAIEKWENTDKELRLKYLDTTINVIKKMRSELVSLLICELGMTWNESQKEVDNTIDFINYLTQKLLNLSLKENFGNIRGENNRIIYQPRGIGLILSSYTSGLSSPISMIITAIMTGNCVIFSPPQNGSIIGYKIHQIFKSTKLPRGVINFIPNTEQKYIQAISKSEKIKFIVYSGSRRGLARLMKINSSKFNEVQKTKIIKYSITGNNPIIVDSDADIDNALKNIVKSVLSFQGQKSSSCSRLILLEEIYDQFNSRLIEVINSLNYGPTENPKNIIGALVNEEVKLRFEKQVNLAKSNGKILIERTMTDANDSGYFPAIVVVHDLPPQSKVLKEEIIGPLLCVIKVQNFIEAVNAANTYDGALTGSVYSRSPSNILFACQKLNVGHIFINQNSCEGFVGRQEYGGYSTSGIGKKAEVNEFIKEFVVMKAITENTIRRGYSPG